MLYLYKVYGMKSIVVICAVLLAVAGTELRAQSASIGGHIGWDTKQKDYYVGGNGWFSLGGLGLGVLLLNANVNIYPQHVDDGLYNVQANAALGFSDPTATIVPFAGAGIAFLHHPSDADGKTSETGLNLTAGLLVQLLGLRPFAQGALTFGSSTVFTVQAGLSLGI